MLFSKDKNKVYTGTKGVSSDFPIVFANGVSLNPKGYPNLGVLPFEDVIPVYDNNKERIEVESIEDVTDEDGVVISFRRIYTAITLTEDEITAKSKEAAYLDGIAGSRVRATRDKLLLDTDWIVTKSIETGIAIPEEWKAYRESLRDITDQPGVPQDVNFPPKPNN